MGRVFHSFTFKLFDPYTTLPEGHILPFLNMGEMRPRIFKCLVCGAKSWSVAEFTH